MRLPEEWKRLTNEDSAVIGGLSRPPLRPPAAYLVVLCHGHGNDADGMRWLADRWAPLFPRAAFLSLDGWEPCVLNPGTRQWWSLKGRTPESDQAGAARIGPPLAAFVRAAAARLGLAAGQVALAGFSQGAMSVLAASVMNESRAQGAVAAAAVSFAGALHLAEQAAIDPDDAPHVLLVHGDADDVVPLDRSLQAESRLRKAGVPVELAVLPGVRHEVTAEAADLAAGFISKILGAAVQTG